MKFTNSCHKGAQLKNDDSDYELREELCILFQDMIDCLMSSENFEQFYYKKNDLENVVEYSLKDNTIGCYIDSFFCYQSRSYTIIFDYRGNNKITIVHIYPEEYRIEISDGYRELNIIDDYQLDLFEKTVRWCEKINPEYW